MTPLSCYGSPQCQIFTNAVSPMVVSNLTNGTLYSFTVNGRIDGGPGGTGSPAVTAIPRLAGGIWVVGTPIGSTNINGIAYGTFFVAVGDSGALFTSTDGINWVAPTLLLQQQILKQ